MSEIIQMDEDGGLIIPKEIRDQMQLNDGSQIEVRIVGDQIELTPATKPYKIEHDVDGLPAISGWKEYDAGKAVLEARDEQRNRLSPEQ